MNDNPYSWCNVQHMDRLIRKDKEEFKEKELKNEERRAYSERAPDKSA